MDAAPTPGSNRTLDLQLISIHRLPLHGEISSAADSEYPDHTSDALQFLLKGRTSCHAEPTGAAVLQGEFLRYHTGQCRRRGKHDAVYLTNHIDACTKLAKSPYTIAVV